MGYSLPIPPRLMAVGTTGCNLPLCLITNARSSRRGSAFFCRGCRQLVHTALVIRHIASSSMVHLVLIMLNSPYKIRYSATFCAVREYAFECVGCVGCVGYSATMLRAYQSSSQPALISVSLVVFLSPQYQSSVSKCFCRKI